MKSNTKRIIYYFVTCIIVFLIYSVSDHFKLEFTESIIFYVVAFGIYETIVISIDKIGDRIAKNKLISSNDETDTKGKP